MKHFFTLGAVAMLAVACGGTFSSGEGKGGVGEGDAGPETGTGGDPNGAGGSGAAGGPSVGGAPSAGGAPSTGGAPGNECTDPGDCAVAAVCKVCPDGSESCATGDCVNGRCETFYPACQGGACGTSRDCPQIGAPCQICPDGTSACPSVECLNGQCVGSFPSCGGTPPPTQCTSDTDCPQVELCMPCPDGSCASVNVSCVQGQCVSGGSTCGGSTGTLQWYMTCGAPVCGGPGTPSSGLPACDPNMGQKAGAACQKDGDLCDPGSGCGESLRCSTSDPTNGGMCPISRAQYKQEIQYLSRAERAKLAEDLQSIPLVRYRYKNGSEREHLGFIIEDIEPSPSVDSKRDQVDLYGYTSMAVAALQQQHAQIEELRRELKALRAELGRKSAR